MRGQPGFAPRGGSNGASAGEALEPGRGRLASAPSEIPARGWKDILLRVYRNISDHRVLCACRRHDLLQPSRDISRARRACRDLWSVCGPRRNHGAPRSGIRLYAFRRDRCRARPAYAGRLEGRSRRSGVTFAIGLGVSLWSANAAMKSLFDTLNIVYAEQEKRGFIKLNAISLTFTAAAVAFVLVAIAAVVVLPVALKYIGLSDFTDLLLRIARWPALFVALGDCAGADLSLRSEPRGAAVAMDYMGQCRGCAAVARSIGAVLLLCRQLRQFQRDLRFAGRGHRLHDLAVDFRDRDIARGGA